jgi:hypothetical protein
MIALKESVNEMMADLMEFKERCAANDVMQKEIIQEQQERIEELEDNRDAGSGMKKRMSGSVSGFGRQTSYNRAARFGLPR